MRGHEHEKSLLNSGYILEICWLELNFVGLVKWSEGLVRPNAEISLVWPKHA